MTEKIPEKKYLSVAEVAAETGYSVRTIRKLCKEGRIGSSQPERRGRYLIPRESLDEYMSVRR